MSNLILINKLRNSLSLSMCRARQDIFICMTVRSLSLITILLRSPTSSGLHKLHVQLRPCTLICDCVLLSFFFPVLGCLLLSVIMLPCLLQHCTVQIFLFACFYRNQFCSPAINQICVSQYKGWFPFIILSSGENIIEQVH